MGNFLTLYTRGRKCAKVRTKKEKSYKKLHKKRNRTESDAKKELLEVAKSGTKKEFLYTICAGGRMSRKVAQKELCNTITRRSRKP